MNREIKFRAFVKGEMHQLDQITITDKTWTCENGRGISLTYQSHIPVMQFTGLTDKNGKEIYEGDIVEWDEPEDRRMRETVEYKEGSFYPVCMQPDYLFEIVGNAFENPELIKP